MNISNSFLNKNIGCGREEFFWRDTARVEDRVQNQENG